MLDRWLALGCIVMASTGAQAGCVGLLLPGPETIAAPFLQRFEAALAAEPGGEGARVVAAYAGEGGDGAEAAAGLPDDCAVMVGASLREVRALRARFPAKPVVMVAVGDPVGAGLAASLPRPGGRTSGLTDFKPDYAESRVLLVQELVPSLKRLAFLHNPDAPTARLTLEAAARHGIDIVPLVARSGDDLRARLGALPDIVAQALLVVPYPLTFANRRAIAEAAAQRRLPVVFGYADFMDLPAPAAGIASLGADLGDLYRRAAGYAAKMLAGADPATQAIETPAKDQLVLNAGVAKHLGLQLSPALRARASDVLE